MAATTTTCRRTALALLATSAGVPMITGGDEMLRTQHGNNNPYNLDSPANWLDWSRLQTHAGHHTFVRRLFAFRRAHAALRPADFDDAVTFFTDTGVPAEEAYLMDPGFHALAYRIDGAARGDADGSIYVAYNGWRDPVRFTLPPAGEGRRWLLAADTSSAAEAFANMSPPGEEVPLPEGPLTVEGRSLALLVAR